MILTTTRNLQKAPGLNDSRVILIRVQLLNKF